MTVGHKIDEWINEDNSKPSIMPPILLFIGVMIIWLLLS